MQAFFKPGSAINKDHKEKYLHILAYAASVYDNEDGERCVSQRKWSMNTDFHGVKRVHIGTVRKLQKSA